MSNNKKIKFQNLFPFVHLFDPSLPSTLIYIVCASVIWSWILKYIGLEIKTLNSYFF